MEDNIAYRKNFDIYKITEKMAFIYTDIMITDNENTSKY